VGFISPGVLAIFLLGFFWKRTTAAAALTGSLLTIPVSTILKFLPAWTGGVFPDFPFLDRMAIDFVIIVLIMILISLYKPSPPGDSHTIEIDKKDFKVQPAFILGSVIIMGILVGLYTVFW
jgi:SSS family solute:Na+ symporter